MPQMQTLRFDAVHVAPNGSRTYSLAASDCEVQQDSKCVMADRGRRKLRLKDVERVATRGGEDGSPPVLFVEGRGKEGSSLRCTLAANCGEEGMSRFRSFADGLKAAHRRALRKAGLPDPYGNDAPKTAASRANRANKAGGKRSAAPTKARGIRSRLPGRAPRADVPSSSAGANAPRPPQGGVFLTSPARQHGGRAYASPARQRRGGLPRSSSGGRGNSPEEEEGAAVVSGNVLRESPSKKGSGNFFLPSRSPRNASPAKLRDAGRSRTGGDAAGGANGVEDSSACSVDDSPARDSELKAANGGGKQEAEAGAKKEKGSGILSFLVAREEDDVEDPSDEYETDDQRGGSSQDTAASRAAGESDGNEAADVPDGETYRDAAAEAPGRPSLKERFDRVADLDDGDGREEEEGSDDIYDQPEAGSASPPDRAGERKRPRDEAGGAAAAVVSVKKPSGSGGDKIRLTTVNTFRATGQLVSARKSPHGSGGEAARPRKAATADASLAASPDTASKSQMKGLLMNWITKDKAREAVAPAGQGPGLFGAAASTPVKGPTGADVRSPLGVRAPRSARPPSMVRKPNRSRFFGGGTRADENDAGDGNNVDDLPSEDEPLDESLDRIASHAGGRENENEPLGVREGLNRSWERRADEHDEYESQRASHERMSGAYREGRRGGGRPRGGRLNRLQMAHAGFAYGRNANGLWPRTDGSGRSALGRPSLGRGAAGSSYYEDTREEGREDESNLYEVEGRSGRSEDDDDGSVRTSFHLKTPGGLNRRRNGFGSYGHRSYGRQSTADAALGGRRHPATAMNPYNRNRWTGGGGPPGTPPTTRRSWNPKLVGNSATAAADRRMTPWYGAGALGSGPSSDAPGMQNLGNTCYLSASIQTLFSMPAFLAGLYKTYEHQNFTMPDKELPLTRALLEIAVALDVVRPEDAPLIDEGAARGHGYRSRAADPVALKRQMDVITDKFAGYLQRDAHEFFADLIDFLHDELEAVPRESGKVEGEGVSCETNGNSSDKVDDVVSPDGEECQKENSPREGPNGTPTRKKRQEAADGNRDAQSPSKGTPPSSSPQSRDPACPAVAKPSPPLLPTDDFFRLKVRVCLRCDSCGYSRSKEEMYRHLSVDVGEDADGVDWTVGRSLDRFFQHERRELKCEKCDAGKTATQKLEIISFPKAILLHFKRFIVTQEVKTRIHARPGDPPEMEMVLRKNKARIPTLDSLSLAEYAAGGPSSVPRGDYGLRGLVHHVGSTASSGHYTACVRRPRAGSGADQGSDEEDWIFFDDRNGFRRDLSYVNNERNQRNMYLALYELR